jgi:zinc metalloprotease ZmpB
VKTARGTTVLAALAAAILVAAATAFAADPGPGTSTGSATVFAPNPVADLQDQTLTDQKDADYAALAPAYHRVVLTNLDGSGFLRGDWANVLSETGNPANSPTNEFHYRRNDDRFEQVMAYYWITEAQKYIQSLGFGSRLRPVNMESQDVRINQWGADNSFSWDKKDMIKLGKGGVDDAEDAEVILHELGHAIQDSQQNPFGYGFGFEARSIGEGFADYWAVTVADVLAPTPDPACVADWDSVSYTSTTPHCLRRVDLNLHYPENVNPNSVHSTGRIWSRALWDIRKALGYVKADTIVLESHFGQRDPTMRHLAESTVAAAQRLYGPSAANKVRASFEARGIL